MTKNDHIPSIRVYISLFAFALVSMFFSFTFQEPLHVLQGFWRILKCPSQLLTDYMFVGGIGAAFFNASLMLLLASIALYLSHQKLTGIIVAGLCMVFGFAFFGKNPFNSLPIVLGICLYAWIEGLDVRTLSSHALFGIAIGPAVSYFCFGLGLPFWQGFPLSYALGIGIGFILPVLAKNMFKAHGGYTLYNVGFTCGIIGLFIQGFLRTLGKEVQPVSLISQGNTAQIAGYLYLMFISMILLGFVRNRHSIMNIGQMLCCSGHVPSDFTKMFGYGISFMNMGSLGILFTSFVLVLHLPLNGPIVGSIFAAVGFGSFGKNLRNVWSIMLGCVLAYSINAEDLYTTPAVLSILFATNLAPIAGVYGWIAGMLAGFFHVSIVQSMGYLHGGFNLYNNGFTGGFVAMFLVPLLDALRHSTFLLSKRIHKLQKTEDIHES